MDKSDRDTLPNIRQFVILDLLVAGKSSLSTRAVREKLNERTKRPLTANQLSSVLLHMKKHDLLTNTVRESNNDRGETGTEMRVWKPTKAGLEVYKEVKEILGLRERIG